MKGKTIEAIRPGQAIEKGTERNLNMFFGCILFLNGTQDFNQDLRANVNRAVGIQRLNQGRSRKPNSDTETNGKHKRKEAKGSQAPIHTHTNKSFCWNKTKLHNNKNNRPTLTKTSLKIVLLNEWVE